MRQLPPLDQLSPFCLEYYKNCSNESELDVRNPATTCWREWLDDCTVTQETSPHTVILVIVIIVIAILSLIGNSIVCVVFCLYGQLRLVKHYFVVNLAVVDNILVTVSIPLFVAFLLGRNQDYSLCQGQIVLDIVCGTASIMSLAAISVERYVAVQEPLLYTTKVTPNRTVAAMICTWVYSFLVSFVVLFSLFLDPKEACLFFGGGYVVFITLASFVIPVGVMVFAYWHIFQTAHRHATRIMALVPRNNDNDGREERDTSKHRLLKLKRELRGAKTLTIIMGTHIICWCPLFIYFLVDTFCTSCDRKSAIIANYIILVLRYCNTLANPIIYTGINRQFRAAIMKFVLNKQSSDGLGATVYNNV